MGSWKCAQCGLVNFANAEQCQRCGAAATAAGEVADADVIAAPKGGRSFRQRALWIAGMTGTILVICYCSLRLTSDAVTWQQQQIVDRAIDQLAQRGFNRETFVLRHLVSYRTTDNWWNMQVGHESAYAATNFPFEIMTLYPEFFETARDDTERAAILLHESYHLFGANEPRALEQTWRNKARLGWTADKYGTTKVWLNTKELTMRAAPALFRCGPEQNEDCIQ
jgi:hypothetical protein